MQNLNFNQYETVCQKSFHLFGTKYYVSFYAYYNDNDETYNISADPEWCEVDLEDSFSSTTYGNLDVEEDDIQSINEWLSTFDIEPFVNDVWCADNKHYQEILEDDYRYLGAKFSLKDHYEHQYEVTATLSNGLKKKFCRYDWFTEDDIAPELMVLIDAYAWVENWYEK